eukprot:Tbor_TRINITY_DN4777_c0_g1::TRINITY_DN4777_c0_g1_i1::g.17033::m.17033
MSTLYPSTTQSTHNVLNKDTVINSSTPDTEENLKNNDDSEDSTHTHQSLEIIRAQRQQKQDWKKTRSLYKDPILHDTPLWLAALRKKKADVEATKIDFTVERDIIPDHNNIQNCDNSSNTSAIVVAQERTCISSMKSCASAPSTTPVSSHYKTISELLHLTDTVGARSVMESSAIPVLCPANCAWLRCLDIQKSINVHESSSKQGIDGQDKEVAKEAVDNISPTEQLTASPERPFTAEWMRLLHGIR